MSMSARTHERYCEQLRALFDFVPFERHEDILFRLVPWARESDIPFLLGAIESTRNPESYRFNIRHGLYRWLHNT